MPGFITHYLGGQAMVAQLPAPMQRLINNRAQIFTLGAQGPDIFFYYLPGLLRKRSRGVGEDIHKSRFGHFFTHMARQLREEPRPARQKAMFAYLSGMLAHYALDAYTHPFVYAHTARIDSSRLCEMADHRHFETAVDVLMLARLTGTRPADWQRWQLIAATSSHKRAAAAVLGAAIRAVYNRVIYDHEIFAAMGYMVLGTKLLQSQHGKRKRILARLEDATLGARLLSGMVHMEEVTDGRDYLNLACTPWHAPNASLATRCCFPELFAGATQDAAGMVQYLYAYMRGDVSRTVLMARVGNRSLLTGI